MPSNVLSQQQKVAQEQTLSARQMQSLELLHLPLLELQERILQELASNPVIEDVAPVAEEPVPELASGAASENGDDFPAGDDDALPESLGEDWLDDMPIPDESADPEGGSERRERLFGNLVYEEDMQQRLLEEIRFADLTPKRNEIAEMIVGSLDDSGYLATPTADIAMACDVDLDEVETVLAIVQNLAPAGIGARDLSECLLLQLERRRESTPLLRRILKEFLPEIGKNHLPQVARSLGISMDELNAALEKIRRLDPHPGLSAATENHGGYVVPELSIVPDGDGFKVVGEDAAMPRLHLSERYCRMLEDPGLSGEDRGYIREKLASARELMRALALRRGTIVRIAEVIAVDQADFLRHGVAALKPMTMKQLAERLEVHETTVSRAVSGKYIATPQGVFELRYFFSGGYRSESGEGEVSSRAIKEKIRELIEAEDPRKPLSDDRISRSLKDAGFTVARRTVAKYREAMNLLPTNLRRKH